jgi:hypothetical protein
MKPALLLAASLAAAAQQNTLTPQEKKAGWILLFDGKTMKGWDDPRKKTPPGDAWTIEDGCLRTLKNPRITEDLFTRRKFRDFELKFEWRISPGGNSGVKYRIQEHLFVHRPEKGERFEASVERSFVNRIAARPDKGQDYVVGFEYQITDDRANLDAMSSRKHAAGALYDMVAPSASPARAAGEFNETRILVRGRSVEHWLNGVKVVDTALDAPEALEGIKKRWRDAPHVLELLSRQPVVLSPVSLQNHGDDAWFRNIRIRELKY